MLVIFLSFLPGPAIVVISVILFGHLGGTATFVIIICSVDVILDSFPFLVIDHFVVAVAVGFGHD